MFIELTNRWINVDNIVDVIVYPAQEARRDEFDEYFPERELRVELVTTATHGIYDDGGDYPSTAHSRPQAYRIVLYGYEAEGFLEQLRGKTEALPEGWRS